MKVHLIKKTTIESYCEANSQGRKPFSAWLSVLKFAEWNNPEDMEKTYPSADLLGNGTNRVVFDIGGNKYRIICKYAFGATQVHLFVCWIGTHAEYTKICNNNKQYTINLYK